MAGYDFEKDNDDLLLACRVIAAVNDQEPFDPDTKREVGISVRAGEWGVAAADALGFALDKRLRIDKQLVNAASTRFTDTFGGLVDIYKAIPA